MELGCFFEFMATGSLPRDGKIPVANVIYKGTAKQRLDDKYQKAMDSALFFKKIIQHYDLDKSGVLYLEFGVAQALSFKWWINRLKNQNSKFIGFDTFEGLPEDWGTFFKKGDMLGNIPNLNDDRATFVKGIFQDTLNNYIDQNKEDVKGKRKIIHMDADLFSATIFTLSQFYPYLNKGDIILFDEFNVANHEYFAFKIFTEAYYVKLKPIAAINNFYQVAFVVE